MAMPAVSTFMFRSTFAVFLTAIMAIAFACVSDEELPTVEARAQAINKTVMCPVCPGESLDQSQHPRAKAMRGVVVDKLEEGWANDDIRQFFVERYGPSVLLEPPREGLNWLVWVVPPVGIVVAALALYLALRLAIRSSPRRDGTTDEIVLTQAERDNYFKRIEAALASDSDDERSSRMGREAGDTGEAVAG